MALNKATLQAAIAQAFNDQLGKTDNQQAAVTDLADKIATAIDTYIRTATVNTTVTGTCPAGSVTGTGIGQLS